MRSINKCEKSEIEMYQRNWHKLWMLMPIFLIIYGQNKWLFKINDNISWSERCLAMT